MTYRNRKREAVWYVRRESDGKLLHRDGTWAAPSYGYYHKLKLFRRSHNALKHGLKGENGTAYAVYQDDESVTEHVCRQLWLQEHRDAWVAGARTGREIMEYLHAPNRGRFAS